MRVLLRRLVIRMLPLCLLLAMVAGCDDDDWSSGEVIDIIYAAGDVALAILRMIFW